MAIKSATVQGERDMLLEFKIISPQGLDLLVGSALWVNGRNILLFLKFPEGTDRREF